MSTDRTPRTYEYVLDLLDPEEKDHFEREMELDPDLGSTVESVRRLARDSVYEEHPSEDELRSDPEAQLHALECRHCKFRWTILLEQARLEPAALTLVDAGSSSSGSKSSSWPRILGFAAAACLGFAVASSLDFGGSTPGPGSTSPLTLSLDSYRSSTGAIEIAVAAAQETGAVLVTSAPLSDDLSWRLRSGDTGTSIETSVAAPSGETVSLHIPASWFSENQGPYTVSLLDRGEPVRVWQIFPMP